MGLVSFDAFNLYERPVLVLCKPNLEQQYVLGNVINLRYSPRFNALSDLSFTAFEYINGIKMPYYDYLVNRKIVYVEEFGYFQITKTEEDGNGKKTYKDISCQSIEVQLITKSLGVFKGTYRLYNAIDPSGTLLQEIIEYLPDWSIGNVDAAVAVKYRTFDINDSTIYQFLMTDVEEAYECVFDFNTADKTISCYDRSTATTNTDIYISYDNVIQNISLEEIYDEMVTSLTVLGAGDLSINQVNPLGNDNIYKFTHYKTTEWMTQSLINAITAWENLIDANQTTYASTLTNLLDNHKNLITLNSALITLQGELSALENVKTAKIQGGLSLSSINAGIAAKELQITNKRSEISGVEVVIQVIVGQLTAINTLLSFESNFTAAQIKELQPYIVQSGYTNENFIQTSIMSNADIQEQAQGLYDQAMGVLARISEPRYNFNVDSINFPLIKDFQIFTNQLVLGAVVNLEIKPDVVSYPVLLGFDLDYDNPENFKLIFGNRLRLDNSAFQYSDLMNGAISSGITTKMSSQGWAASASYVNNTVNTFINSALDAAVNNVVSGSAQNMTLTTSGLRGRQMLSDGSYDPKQLWMVNNMLAFSDDGFQTAKLAVGEISLPGGGTGFGVVGDYLVGRILAGNSLTITNDSSTFSVDGGGATLTNAILSVENSKNKIFLDPINGIRIQGNAGGTWTDRFYADTSGNIHIKGILEAATGTFAGALSAATGTFRGTLSAATGTFSGTVSAGNFTGGTISGAVIQGNSISGNTISGGTISGGAISGGTIGSANLSSCNIYSSYISAATGITTRSLGVTQSSLFEGRINATGIDSSGTNTFSNLTVLSTFQANGGISTNVGVRNSAGTGVVYLRFVRGIYVGTI